jgi:hypothetical protein
MAERAVVNPNSRGNPRSFSQQDIIDIARQSFQMVQQLAVEESACAKF